MVRLTYMFPSWFTHRMMYDCSSLLKQMPGFRAALFADDPPSFPKENSTFDCIKNMFLERKGLVLDVTLNDDSMFYARERISAQVQSMLIGQVLMLLKKRELSLPENKHRM